ncbi:MAG: RHS repeat-associated core domain-containing protein, partial [Clostridiaceae bacterium]|nr:RHS repeat-associated core domain-containing protein [Clostridiaceae bacterium]
TGMITDNSANITQGFLYTPFGELLYEYDPGWESGRIPKYSFNAKELDEENNMYYYSARYYAPPTFISRDPMFEKYPSISPYTYCANNPLKFVDPTGMIVDPVGDEETALYNEYKQILSDRKDRAQDKVDRIQNRIDQGKYVGKNALSKAQGQVQLYQGIENELCEMENSTTIFQIRMGDNRTNNIGNGNTQYDVGTNIVHLNIGDGGIFTPIQNLSHELLHGFQYLMGEIDFDASGKGYGPLGDRHVEKAAYERSNLFGHPADGNIVNPVQAANQYSKLEWQKKSYNGQSDIEKVQYNKSKNAGRIW